MRRRSERKKSTDVSSPAPSSRRTSRRSRKSPSFSENEKNSETSDLATEEKDNTIDNNENTSNQDCASESVLTRRGSRNRTPAKEQSNSPSKRRNAKSSDENAKIPAIAEEENCPSPVKLDAADDEGVTDDDPKNDEKTNEKTTRNELQDSDSKETNLLCTEVTAPLASFSPKEVAENKLKSLDVLEIQTEYLEKTTDEEGIPPQNSEEPEGNAEESEISRGSNGTNLDDKDDQNNTQDDKVAPTPTEEFKEPSTQVISDDVTVSKSHTNSETEINTSLNPGDIIRTTRKRKWLTKKINESKTPILSISTDSLKTLIADVQPVPLSDVQLESSSEVEEVVSEREEGEETPSPEPERRRTSVDNKIINSTMKRNQNDSLVNPDRKAGITSMQRSPSPARNHSSSVLFITNLVRPFTVLQLKGLLARTGKIVEDGFWIDRIKSKCYVQYETEDEAIETRHALHGVRWPVSNPKCLNVDFGIKADMDRAIQSSKEDLPKYGQDTNRDNLIIGTGWNRDRNDDEKKTSRHIREWDVGKKESLDREKRDRDREFDKRRSRERDLSGNREGNRTDKDKKNRSRGRSRSNSLSPVRKMKKKENDPPLRLLDDLFRKTKATPCIYWLPLTPEQIAEKEAFRQKRIEEHKQRVKQRELEREKEREKDKNRGSDRDRDREPRRNRSNDRRRSRSRDRRRY